MEINEAIDIIEGVIEIQTALNDGETKSNLTQAHETILASAKVLHQHVIPQMHELNVNKGLDTNYKTIYGVPVEEIGYVQEDK